MCKVRVGSRQRVASPDGRIDEARRLVVLLGRVVFDDVLQLGSREYCVLFLLFCWGQVAGVFARHLAPLGRQELGRVLRFRLEGGEERAEGVFRLDQGPPSGL